MPRGKPITLPVIRTACDHYAMFGSWTAAARHAELSYTGLMRALNETFTEEKENAAFRFQDRIRTERVERAFDKSDKSSSWFLQHLATEHLPETQQAMTRKFEIAGEGGGPVRVVHEQRLTLADLYRAFPGSSAGDSGQLPAARPVLPPPSDDQPPAG